MLLGLGGLYLALCGVALCAFALAGRVDDATESGPLLGDYVHPSHFLDDLKFVADVIGLPPAVVRNEQRGVSPEAPRASSLRGVP